MSQLLNIHTFISIIWLLIMGACFTLGYLLRKVSQERKIGDAKKLAENVIKEAEREAETKRREAALEAKDYLYKTRQEHEKEIRDRRQELSNLEKRLLSREENLDRRVDLLEKKEKEFLSREREISSKERTVREKEEKYQALLEEHKRQLEKISGMTSEEAKKLLILQMEEEAKRESALMIKRIEDEARETADKKAKDVISLAIQRCAADHVVETTVSVVDLPNEEMKGRIIGREGRNIRALEIATGVDLIIDDTPEAVIISGYDSIRREIARISLERLIVDGRIHPARIEEIVEKVKKEMENTIKEEGEKACFDVGIHGLHPEEVRLIGRLKYRTSYGQNVLQHSKEVAYLASVMASELSLDVKLAKRAGLLHDIGKAVDHEVEGTHARIGAELARKFGESKWIVHAVASHHYDEEPKTAEAVLIAAADALSAARPGARREMLETYIKRLEKLEEIADSFRGVEKAYAIQAGREIRIMVESDVVSDIEASQLAREISKRIEKELEYPGQIKVTVIRETRSVEYAR